MEPARRGWAVTARRLPRNALTGAVVLVKEGYQALKTRHGPRYTEAMLGAAFLALFMPLPGSVLVGVAVVVVIAEVHRTIAKRGGFPEAVAEAVVVVKAHMPFWATGRWASRPR